VVNEATLRRIRREREVPSVEGCVSVRERSAGPPGSGQVKTPEERARIRAHNRQLIEEVERHNASLDRDRDRDRADLVRDSCSYFGKMVQQEIDGSAVRHNMLDAIEAYKKQTGRFEEP